MGQENVEKLQKIKSENMLKSPYSPHTVTIMALLSLPLRSSGKIPGKSSTRKTDLTGDRTRVRWARGNDVTAASQRWSAVRNVITSISKDVVLECSGPGATNRN